jgi:hypothetical protein
MVVHPSQWNNKGQTWFSNQRVSDKEKLK